MPVATVMNSKLFYLCNDRKVLSQTFKAVGQSQTELATCAESLKIGCRYKAPFANLHGHM